MLGDLKIYSHVICSIGIVFIFITMVIVLSYEINIDIETSHYKNRQKIKSIAVGVLGGLLLLLCNFLSINEITPYYIGVDIFIGLVAYVAGKIISANIALSISIVCCVILLGINHNKKLVLFHIISSIIQMLILNIIKSMKLRLTQKRDLDVALLTMFHVLLIYIVKNDFNVCLIFGAINLVIGFSVAWVTDNLSRLVKMYNAYRKQALTDALTGLANVRAYNSIVSHIAKNKEKDWAVIYIDIDNFKNVNQEYGHSTGDIIIRGVGKTIKNIVPHDDFCFRVGGDEFLVLHNQTSLVSAEELAYKIKNSINIKQFFSLKEKEVINITLSMGINKGKVKTCSFCELVQKADMAMYEAKRQGKNKVAVSGVNSPCLDIMSKNNVE